MRDIKLEVTPFQFIDILECFVYKAVNEHFTARVVGHIAQTDNDELVRRCPEEQAVCIRAVDAAGESKVIFKGIVRTIAFQIVGGLRKLTLEAVSRTWLMDVEEHTRTFQFERQTYKEVADFIKEKNEAAFVYTRGIDEQVGEILVQYEETDWNFLKRIASQINTVVVADEYNDNIVACFGIPQKREMYQASSAVYSVEKALDEYADKNACQVKEFGEADVVDYVLEERELWELGAPVNFLGQTLYVYKIISRYDSKEFVHTYSLRTKSGFKTKRRNNRRLSGCSLEGTVIDVVNDSVKVHCKADERQEVLLAKWFAYSTVYSHPNGTGWYCMPEIGDAVRIYFPNQWERDGYAISAIHRDNRNRRRINPDIKTLCSIHDKEIEFTPETIRITNNNGLTVLLDDRQGISMFSNKDILLCSGENIRITADKAVAIQGREGVLLQKGENAIEITNVIREWAEGIYHK